MLVKNLVKEIVLTSLAACLLLASNAAWAYTYYYNTMGDGKYDTSGNWSAGLPTAGGTGYIEGYTVTLAANVSGYIPDELIVGDSTGSSELDVNAGANLAVGSSTGLFVGSGGNGAIVQGGGTVASGQAYIGYGSATIGLAAGGSGTVTLNGGSFNVGYFVVGSYGGTGTVVQNGGSSAITNMLIGYDSNFGTSPTGTFTQTGGTATVAGECYLGYDATSTGAYSISNGSLSVGYLDVGQYGAATFTQTGGTVTTPNDFEVGVFSGSSGTITVNGGSFSTAGQGSVGFFGNGALVQGGGTVTTSSVFYVGCVAGSSGTVTLNGGSFNVGSDMLVGVGGNGAVVQTGGTMTVAGNYLIAMDPGATGNCSISNGSLSMTGQLQVGQLGPGTFTQNGGTVNANCATVVGVNAGAAGTLTINAGTFNCGGSLSGGSGTSTVNVTGGVVNASGYNISALNTFNFSGGTITNVGIVSTAVTLGATGTVATFEEDGGIYAAGTISGNISGNGKLTKTGVGALDLTGADSYAGLTTIMGGTLELGVNARTPLLGVGGVNIQSQTAKLIFDYVVGSDPYSTIKGLLNGSIYASGAGVHPLICLDNTTTHKDTVESALAGDADLNGTVNGSDLNTVLSNYNKTGYSGITGWEAGDFDGNGTVNGSDLNTVLSNYNQVASATAAVPEPSTLVLLATGLASLLFFAWRRRV